MALAPIRFIGHYDVAAEGKFMWEILCQLRNMGVGRLVTKSEWQKKWPQQSSFLKIVKARPEMDRWQQRGYLWAEWTFRGRNLGVYKFEKDLSRSDWRLIHKNEEKDYLENTNQMPLIEVPDTFPIPPLQKLLAQKQAEKNGKPWKSEMERAPLHLCIDPQFEMLKPFFKQSPPSELSDSIYEEIRPATYLDLYGKLLPPKVEAWAVGPARPNFHFKPIKTVNEDA